MYRSNDDGPGPRLMGANTLTGDEVYNHKNEKLAEHKRFVLNVEKEKLENAPGFNTDHWPNMADETWANSIHNYYDIEYIHTNL